MPARRSFIAAAFAIVTLATALAAAAAPRASKPRHDPRPNGTCASEPSRWQREQCEAFVRSAPGDEYFGPMKISYLGIDNTAHDVAIEAGAYTTNPALISRVHFADLALRDWERKYPDDPQLARSYFLMIRVLEKIYTQAEQREAYTYMLHVIHRFGHTYFGKILRADVARGFTEHWFAAAQPCPTPARNQIGQLAPIVTPPPTPKPRRGQPKVDILAPPCMSAST